MATQTRQALVLSIAMLGCGPANVAPPHPENGPPSAQTTADDIAAKIEQTPIDAPPPPGEPAALALPPPVWKTANTGFAVGHVLQEGPRLELRLIVEAGFRHDDDKPGIAYLAGQALANGGTGALSPDGVARAFAEEGVSLSVRTTADTTVFSLSAPADDWERPADRLAALLLRPSFNPARVARQRDLLAVTAEQHAFEDARFAAMRVLAPALFPSRGVPHPYAATAPLAAELAALDANDVKAFQRARYLPSAMTAITVGPVPQADVVRVLHKSFGGPARDAPASSITDEPPPNQRRYTVVDWPHADVAHIFVAHQGSGSTPAEWAPLAVLTELLEGSSARGIEGVLEREAGLVVEADSEVLGWAEGRPAFVLHATGPVEHAGATARRLQDQLGLIAIQPPSPEHVRDAVWATSGRVARRLTTAPAIADHWAETVALGREDGFLRDVSTTLTGVTGDDLAAAATRLLKSPAQVIVIGPAEDIGPQLTPFGEVKVVDPIRDFSRARTLSATPQPNVGPGTPVDIPDSLMPGAR